MPVILSMLLMLFAAANASAQFYTPPTPPPCPAPGKLVIKPDPKRGFFYVCQYPPKPTPVVGTVTPKFMISHVVYSVPGRSSSMSYVAGDTVGSTTTLSNSQRMTAKVTVGASGSFMGTGSDVSLSWGTAWGTSSENSLDWALTRSSGYRKVGQRDLIDHDDDEVWFMVRPRLSMTVIPASEWGPQSVSWTFAAQRQMVPYYLLVGELKGTREIPPDVWRALDNFGITTTDFSELLKADPFANLALSPNQPLDPARFELVSTFPYRAVATSDGQPSPQTLELRRRVANSSTQRSTVEYSVGFGLQGSVGFMDVARLYFKLNEDATLTSSSSSKTSTETVTTNAITVGQPTFGYAGPTVLRVYEDKVWKTFFFALDWY